MDCGSIRLRDDLPEPVPGSGEVVVEVLRAGICATDLKLARGYLGFRGVPGHEFVGRALQGALAGRRVVGEINAACGKCERCGKGLGRHCARRTVLGILGRPGAFAERLSLPAENLHALPDDLDSDVAVFTEPLAAAFEIVEQIAPRPSARALVAGDGKLGILCAWVLHLSGLAVTVAGRHPERAGLLPPGARHATGWLESDRADRPAPLPEPGREPAPPEREIYPLAVEATGDPSVLARLLRRLEPRGTIVMKTTADVGAAMDLSPLVVDEITLVGSRCGRFAPALDALRERSVDPRPLIVDRFPLEQAERALKRAAEPGALKVLIDRGRDR